MRGIRRLVGKRIVIRLAVLVSFIRFLVFAIRIPQSMMHDSRTFGGEDLYNRRITQYQRSRQQFLPIMIAANYYNNESILPYHLDQLRRFIIYVCANENETTPRCSNVFVSIYENSSTDKTKEILREFQAWLDQQNVWNSVVLDETPTRTMQRASNSRKRILRMADIRNRALDPLRQRVRTGAVDDGVPPAVPNNITTAVPRLVFLNDVVFQAKDLLRLVDRTATTKDELLGTTNNRETTGADAACAIDYNPIKLYDFWAARDIRGKILASFYPYSPAVSKSSDGLLVEAYACWNGLMVLRRPPEEWPRFRAWTQGEVRDPLGKSPNEVYHSHGCRVSECTLFFKDLWKTATTHGMRIVMDTNVRVAYSLWHYRVYVRYLLPLINTFTQLFMRLEDVEMDHSLTTVNSKAGNIDPPVSIACGEPEPLEWNWILAILISLVAMILRWACVSVLSLRFTGRGRATGFGRKFGAGRCGGLLERVYGGKFCSTCTPTTMCTDTSQYSR